jgi:hypothetical protein
MIDEPMSPELVLVAPPDVRARALGGLSDAESAAHLDGIRERGPKALQSHEPPPTTRRLLRVPIAACFAVSAVTLALTFAADHLR